MERPYICIDTDQTFIACALMTSAMAEAMNREAEERSLGFTWVPSPAIGEA